MESVSKSISKQSHETKIKAEKYRFFALSSPNVLFLQKWFILLANYKLSSSSFKNPKNNSKKTPKIPLLHPLKRVLPSISSSSFPTYFLLYLFFQNTQKLPIYNALKEKQSKKRTKKKRTFAYKKNYHKKT